VAGDVECLSQLPQLVDLEVHGSYRTFPCLSSFNRLRRLSVSGISTGCDGLSALVANSPGLLHLNIEGRSRRHKAAPFLPDIFALVSPGQNMRIWSLGLS
jgi:hypothetical protein